ncbi:membrane protein insertase YidC [Helicobacter pylori]|uniref:Membrane protein insertase YidC n=1 Tax=Helicobacter pylori (strain SouthAfrica7) TaxID=907239 RepID=E8QTW4_HELPW|nr:membrane protein insertase YidC [Helicobacter pylori]ADU85328.1 putative inner membrane protein translocase component YidC [Helicobacter pylori SouthAfrica7]
MDKNNNTNLRLILAVALSFLFITLYSYFFQKPNKTTTETTKQEVTHNNTALNPNAPTATQNFSATQTIPQENLLSAISFEHARIEIDFLGRIKQVYLKDKKYLTPKQKGFFEHVSHLFSSKESVQPPLKELPLLGDNLKPLEVRFLDPTLNNKAFNTPYSASKTTLGPNEQLVLTQDLGDLVIIKTLTFYDDLHYDLQIAFKSPNNIIPSYVITNGYRPVADLDSYTFSGVLLENNDKKIEKIEDKDAKEIKRFSNILFLSSVDRYFTTLLFTDNPQGFEVLINPETGTKNPLGFISLKNEATLHGYIGPKDYRSLKAISPMLTDAIEYGLITFFAKGVFVLLDYLYQFVGNWGWAIILLTIIVRIILYPLSYKGMVSMQKLKELAPKMKELQEEYKGEPQKLQAHMMQLYKKHGANPLGGCLPLILQIPVFFAIYRVLYNAVELKSSEWILWIHDLSIMDPYFILPLLMGASMYWHQSVTPNTMTDPMQAKIFKLLPLLFTLFLITFPAGLVLYWTTNNILSVLQQLIINKVLENKKRAHVQNKKEH